MIRLILVLYWTFLSFGTCNGSFVASFQNNIVGPHLATNDVWIEFTNRINATQEFTSCLWFRLKFYNYKYVACLWSYCTVEAPGDEMKCLRICLSGVPEFANRELDIVAQIPSKSHSKATSMRIDSYIHRSWSL